MLYFDALHDASSSQCVGEQLVVHFQAIPIVPRLPGGQNPATWMLKCIGAGVRRSDSGRCSTHTVDFVQHFPKSAEHVALLQELKRPGVGKAASDLFPGNISFVGGLSFTAQERASYYRERNSRTYSVVWYFVGSTVVEIPYAFTSGLIFSIAFYPMLGFYTVVYALPTVELAAIVGVLFNAFFLLFSGFNPPAASIPEMSKWCYYIPLHHYALSILVALAFGECPNEATHDTTARWMGCQPLENSPLSLDPFTIQEYIGQAYNIKYKDI
ncbi:hypothetical protein ON010_g8236 [Phytophthora cinnamomi]|nr:hypothetical protein ON010_g8236 [Phytophthora cinnamomi]